MFNFNLQQIEEGKHIGNEKKGIWTTTSMDNGAKTTKNYDKFKQPN